MAELPFSCGAQDKKDNEITSTIFVVFTPETNDCKADKDLFTALITH